MPRATASLPNSAPAEARLTYIVLNLARCSCRVASSQSNRGVSLTQTARISVGHCTTDFGGGAGWDRGRGRAQATASDNRHKTVISGRIFLLGRTWRIYAQ